MFNIGISELIVVLLIAFLVVGPKDLPRVGAWLGRGMKKIRALLREVREEAGLDSLDREVKEMRQDLNRIRKETDASSELKEEIKTIRDSIRNAENHVDPGIKAEQKPEEKEE